MERPFDTELEERLVRYAAIDSQSDESSPTAPSTEIQYVLISRFRRFLRPSSDRSRHHKTQSGQHPYRLAHAILQNPLTTHIQPI